MASSTTQHSGPALLSRSRRAAVLFTALLVGVLGTGAVVWSWSPAPPPPANTNISDAAATGEPRPTSDEVERPELPARSEAATRTAVVGKALDSGGGALAGFAIALQRTDPMPERIKPREIRLEPPEPARYPTLFGAVDAAGGFAFESLAAGNYSCYIACQEATEETFALAAGEVRELTLQSRLVALTGTLFRRGEVAKDCGVEFSGGNASPREPHPTKAGVMRLFAAPGRYEVIVRLEPRAYNGRGRGPYVSRHVLLVPDDVATLQWSFETGGTAIAFAVEDPQGRAIGSYTAHIDGVGALDQAPGNYVLFGKPGEPAAMAALPAGQWRATVTSNGFRVEPRDFVTGLDDGRVVLTFVASPAATVRLTLRPLSQSFATPDGSDMPALVVDGLAVPCTSALVGGALDPDPIFDFCAVPPGKATLCFQDRIEGDELVPLPFEPIAPVTIDVAIGCANEITVDVEPRAFVNLHGCDASGMEMSTAVLTVWVDGRRVRNRHPKASQRWVGWLPPGVHRVVVDRDGTQREYVLRVDHTNVSARYRP